MLLEQEILSECVAMAKYALGQGLNVPNDIIESVNNAQKIIEKKYNKSEADKQTDSKDVDDNSYLSSLNNAHAELSKLVAPARPNTLELFDSEQKNSFFNFLGPISLARRMMLIAILSLVALIGLSVSKYVNGSPESFGLTTNHGISLLINQLFLMSAAAIGASFAALFQVNGYIKNSTFEPMYESTYWVRFVLGLLAGTMLATLIPLDSVHDKTGGFERPLLALIGGFSATVVFRVLTRLTSAVETIFKGDMKEITAQKELANNMKIEQQNIQNKMALLSQLKNLQSKMGDGSVPKELVDELTQIQNGLLGNNGK